MLRPQIFQVIPCDNFTVYVYFDDGSIRLYDAKPLISKGGIFEKLKDIEFFKISCTILNNTLAWDISGNRDTTKCVDVCPDNIYYHSENANEEEIQMFKTIYKKTS